METDLYTIQRDFRGVVSVLVMQHSTFHSQLRAPVQAFTWRQCTVTVRA